MLQDLRYGLRTLIKQPGFTLIAMLTLALGIGATAAVFSLIQGVLLTPPPYQDPSRLVLIPAERSDGQQTAHPEAWAALQWMEWQKQAKSFEAIGAYTWSFSFMVRNEGSESIEGLYVTKDYFRAVGLQPLLGRTFVASEAAGVKPAPVIIISYGLWQNKFNGDPNIVGKKVRLSRSDTPPTVIGVMPPGVRFLPSPTAAMEPNYNVNALVDFWIPATPGPKYLKEPAWNVVARLKPGVTIQQAQAELAVITASQARADRDFEGLTPRVQSLTGFLNRDGERILFPLLGAAALVLFIACGNAAALLLVRGLQRQQEYAVRSALGVGRIALFRQVSSESLLLAVGGGALGALLAVGVVRLFRLIGGHAIPRLDSVSAGWPVLAIGLALAIVAALLAGLIPALRASRLDTMQVLKSAGPKSSAGIGERRLLRSVTTVQTALTLALLVGAGLLIRTMINLSTVQSGYNTSRVLTMSVTAVQGDWADFHERAIERIGALPGVEGVAFAWGVPLTGNSWPGTLEIEGQPPVNKESDKTAVPLRAVTPGYFKLLNMPLADGRDFRNSDKGKSLDVAIVNQSFADHYFPNTVAIGKHLWLSGRDKPSMQIIGVVANGRTHDLTESPEPEVYLSLWEAHAFSKHLVVRTTANPRQLMAAVQRELRAVDPTVAVENMKTMEQIRDESLASRTFAMQLLIGFAIIGTVLTLVGIYGVLSLSVASRRRELAIRAAVGAQQSHIRNLVFGEGFRLIAGGVVAGLVVALVLSRVLQSFLFGVKPTDPVTLVCVGLLFAAVALSACWAPTRRAAKIDPLEALRYE